MFFFEKPIFIGLMFAIKFGKYAFTFKTEELVKYSETIKDFILSNENVSEYDLSNANFQSETYLINIVLLKLSNLSKLFNEDTFNHKYFSLYEFEAWCELTDYLCIKNFMNPLKLIREFAFLWEEKKYYLLERVYRSYNDFELIKFFDERIYLGSILSSLKYADIFYAYCINNLCKDHILVKCIKNQYYILTWDDDMMVSSVKAIDDKLYINDIDFYHMSYKFCICNVIKRYGYELYIFHKRFLNKKYDMINTENFHNNFVIKYPYTRFI